MPAISENGHLDLLAVLKASRTVFLEAFPNREHEAAIYAGAALAGDRLEKAIKPEDMPRLGKLARESALPIFFEDAMRCTAGEPEAAGALADAYITFLANEQASFRTIRAKAEAERGSSIDIINLLGACAGSAKQFSNEIRVA